MKVSSNKGFLVLEEEDNTAAIRLVDILSVYFRKYPGHYTLFVRCASKNSWEFGFTCKEEAEEAYSAIFQLLPASPLPEKEYKKKDLVKRVI